MCSRAIHQQNQKDTHSSSRTQSHLSSQIGPLTDFLPSHNLEIYLMSYKHSSILTNMSFPSPCHHYLPQRLQNAINKSWGRLVCVHVCVYVCIGFVTFWKTYKCVMPGIVCQAIIYFPLKTHLREREEKNEE